MIWDRVIGILLACLLVPFIGYGINAFFRRVLPDGRLKRFLLLPRAWGRDRQGWYWRNGERKIRPIGSDQE